MRCRTAPRVLHPALVQEHAEVVVPALQQHVSVCLPVQLRRQLLLPAHVVQTCVTSCDTDSGTETCLCSCKDSAC